MDATLVLVILGTTAGLLTAIFGALRFNRQDARDAVETMRALNAELQEAYRRMRDERDDWERRYRAIERRCRDCVKRLRNRGEMP